MKVDTVGLIALLASIVILMLLLTRTTKEHFTSAAGTYPAWSSIVQDVKSVLDKEYTFSLSDFLKYADETAFFADSNTQKQLQLIEQMYSMSFPVTQTDYAVVLPKEVFSATQPYSMSIKYLESMKEQFANTDTSKSYFSSDTTTKPSVYSLMSIRTIEATAVSLRTLAYTYLLDYIGHANPAVKEKPKTK